MSTRAEISLPDPNNPGFFIDTDVFESEEAAIVYARRVWGADENGCIRIVNVIQDDEEST